MRLSYIETIEENVKRRKTDLTMSGNLPGRNESTQHLPEE